MSEAGYSPIARQKTYELVAERLLELIASGRLMPGDAIPAERELAQQFAVGRSSIREALRMLESKGIVRGAGNGGLAVAAFGNSLNHSLDFLLSVDQADFRELFEVRHVLEAEAAALAASRHVEADTEEMRRQIDAMEASLGSEQDFITADLRFHMAIAQATQNRLMVHLMHAIRSQLQRSLASSFHVPRSPESAVELHRLILEAIAARRPDDARTRMHEHVTLVEQAVARYPPPET